MSGPAPIRLARGMFLRSMLLLLPALPSVLATPVQTSAAYAQSVGGLDLGGSGEPVEIEATEGIEWHRNDQVYIARGDARIVRGDLTLLADLVRAHYREREDADTEIWRVEAEGNVRLRTPSETVSGDRAIYDVNEGVVVMLGRNLRAETAEETLTAEDSLEYWQRRQLVVARGNAVIVQGDRRLRADVLTGHLEESANGKQELARVDAIGDVRLSTETEFARGERGTYDLETEVATLEGSVKITRGDNQLNGEFAEVDMKSGVSRLLGDRDGTGQSRVRSLIIPSSRSETDAQ